MEYEGYRQMKASEIPRGEQERLRKALQHDLTEALIKSIRANPPNIELAAIELVLRPGQSVTEWSASTDRASCVTCITCITCDTCVTS